MGRSGDCKTCYSRQRPEIEAARAEGRSFAALARDFGIAETSARRHFKDGHARPKPKAGLVTRKFLEDLAAEKGVPFPELLRHWVHCLGGDVSTSTDAEAHELCEMAGLLEEGSPCCAETAE